MSPVVCIPHAGGGASTFVPWQRALGHRVLAVTLPGREGRIGEPPLERITDMAEWVVADLRRREIEDAVLFGHSMGALVAYEVARRLPRSASPAIAQLVVSGCQCPAAFSADHLSEIADDDAFLHAVSAYGGLPAGLIACDELKAYAVSVLRADLGACDRYHHEPGPPLSIPVLAFAGTEDARVPVRDVMGWGGFTDSDFELRSLPGGHFFLTQHMDAMLAEIRCRSERHGCRDELALR
jgi:medium-chain acyl-[acyl-carrier-protein] hydrolase